MPSINQIAKLAVFISTLASVSAHPRFLRPRLIEMRQVPAATSIAAAAATSPAVSAATPIPNAGTQAPVASPAAAAPQAAPPAPAAPAASNTTSGLTDIDILQLYDLI
jgi:hypothetical protein